MCSSDLFSSSRLAWKTRILAPGEEARFFVPVSGSRVKSPALRPFADIVAGRLGDKDGIVFSPFGHPFLYGVADNDTIAVRLYLLNGTKSDWNDVSVRLALPQGWLGRGRARGEFVKPVDLAPGELKVDLGNLASRGEAVAPFWVKTPFSFDRTASLAAANRMLDSEGPARGKLVLSSPGIEAVQEIGLEAAMSATTPKGARIGRRISVYLEICPPGKTGSQAGG